MLYKCYEEREEASGAVRVQGGRGAGGSTGQNETAPTQQPRGQATEVMAGVVGGWDREGRVGPGGEGRGKLKRGRQRGLLQLAWLH